MPPKLNYTVVIPARYNSQRLPGKPLKSILGKPMIQHVYERALTGSASEVIIATDHPEIEKTAKSFGASVVMTSQHHNNGTERVAEVARLMGWPEDRVVVNLQGDEPLMPMALIERVANNLSQRPDAGMASLATPIKTITEVFDPNVVKTLLDVQGFAMIFSRAPLPWYRERYPSAVYVSKAEGIDGAEGIDCIGNGADESPGFSQETLGLPDTFEVLRHIGLYAYRASFLHAYSQQLAPTALEALEALEQLRALYYGVKIHLEVINDPPASGVDTQADLDHVIKHLTGLPSVTTENV